VIKGLGNALTASGCSRPGTTKTSPPTTCSKVLYVPLARTLQRSLTAAPKLRFLSANTYEQQVWIAQTPERPVLRKDYFPGTETRFLAESDFCKSRCCPHNVDGCAGKPN